MPEAAVLQYGALGLLLLVLVFVGKLMTLFVTRTIATFERLAIALEAFTSASQAAELGASRRHGELVALIGERRNS